MAQCSPLFPWCMNGTRMCSGRGGNESTKTANAFVLLCIENYGKPCDKLWKLFAKSMCTQIQKKKAISNEFWNRMNWIKSRTMAGFSSQKCSSEGCTRASSIETVFFSATLWPKVVIMCSNFAPTSSRSWDSNQLDIIRLASNVIHQNMSTKPFKSVCLHTCMLAHIH